METQQQERSDNELIDDFYASQGGKRALKEDLWFYASDWNMLMPVVEKIEELGFSVSIERLCCIINNTPAPWLFAYNITNTKGVLLTKIQSVYKAVVDFIKWYNGLAVNAKEFKA